MDYSRSQNWGSDWSPTIDLTLESMSLFANHIGSSFPPTSKFAVSPLNQKAPLDTISYPMVPAKPEACHISALSTQDHFTMVSFEHARVSFFVGTQEQNSTIQPEVYSNNTRSISWGGSPRHTKLVDELEIIGRHPLVRRSVSLIKRIAHPLPATAVCEGSCAVRSFPPTSLKGFGGYELGMGALLPTVALCLPISLPTHDTAQHRTVVTIPIKRMDSLSRGSLSKIFKRSESTASSHSKSSSESNGVKSLKSLFVRESAIIRRASFFQDAKLDSPTPTSLTPPPTGKPDIANISKTAELVVSVWEEDTGDEEEQNNFRTRLRTKISRGFRQKGRVPSPQPDSERDPVQEEEINQCSDSAGPIRGLKFIPGSKIPPRVFGHKISYETAGNQDNELTRTFTHFPETYCKYALPVSDEVLHIRDGGYEYLTLERINGVTSITAGILECLTAVLAHPLLSPHEHRIFSDNLLACGSMLVGNVKFMEALLRQLKNSTEKPEHQMNIVNFIMHWIKDNPEDFSWYDDILGLKHRILRYIFITFRQTELARSLWNILVKHEELKNSYKRFVDIQMQDWPSFRDIMISYTRPTGYNLMQGDFFETNIDDLTKYMACVDLILFRDGSEIGTLEKYWKEQIYNETLQEYGTNNYFYERPVPWWGVADRVKRFLLRAEMIRHWVVLEILQLAARDERTKMMRLFISVAGNLLQISDFHGACCITQGLDYPLVRQLERSWEDIGYPYIRQFKILREFISSATVYESYLKKPGKGPVIPYYKYFVEKATIIRYEKDHDWRVGSTATLEIHRDVPLGEFGMWNTSKIKAPRSTPNDCITTLVDLKKYRKLHTTVKDYQEWVKPNYQFGGELTRFCFALKLHVVSMKTFTTLVDMENLTPREKRGRLNEISCLIEARLIEAWGLRPKTGIPPTFRDDDAIHKTVLQEMYKAVEFDA